MKGELNLCLLGESLILFEFEDFFEAKRVLLLGPILVEERKMQLEGGGQRLVV